MNFNNKKNYQTSQRLINQIENLIKKSKINSFNYNNKTYFKYNNNNATNNIENKSSYELYNNSNLKKNKIAFNKNQHFHRNNNKKSNQIISSNSMENLRNKQILINNIINKTYRIKSEDKKIDEKKKYYKI